MILPVFEEKRKKGWYGDVKRVRAQVLGR